MNNNRMVDAAYALQQVQRQRASVHVQVESLWKTTRMRATHALVLADSYFTNVSIHSIAAG